MCWILTEENKPGKSNAKTLGTNSKSTIQSVDARQASVREKKGPSLGKRQVKHPHQRSPYAIKFEKDRSHEETERQQRCARSKA